MLAIPAIKQAFKLKGRLYTLTVLQIIDAKPEAFSCQLDKVVASAPKMFDKAPIVLDFSLCQIKDIDFDSVKSCLKAKQLIPIGVQGVTEDLASKATQSGMAVFSSSSNSDKELLFGDEGKKPQEDSDSLQKSNKVTATKLITSPVRSGQQIYAKDCDLIVTATVSRGAELLADGNIHVYGCLRGRALAGIKGDSTCRIFCQDLDAELVSIAGVYALNDKIKQQSAGAKQVYIKDDGIIIDALCK